ncbi:MAG: hypothetical protein AVO34_07605 [Firmicutes bacterium ML8_F2]|jgi:hypothetical protein|nr:MAG: hypothetical protein AVO34_07605 [Firmicutes bacterium ML8_F2]
MRLNEIIKPSLKFARSINLERDFGEINSLLSYQVTTKTIELLDRFVSALEGEQINSWSVTGPYGMGKSAFANFLLNITGPADDIKTSEALKKLNNSAPELCSRYQMITKKMNISKGFVRLPISSAYEPLNKSIARALQVFLNYNSISGKRALMAQLKKLINGRNVDSPSLFNIFKELQSKINSPMIIVIDEFGKNLDYMAHHHDTGDIFILQQLVETESTYLWVFLHQAFDEYARGLSEKQRREWSKVQGRFEDITFIESPMQMLSLLQKVLIKEHENEIEARISKWAKVSYDFISQKVFWDISYINTDSIKKLYPLHPIAALALVSLCSGFAQNDRTLFSFASSGEKYALPSYLAETELASLGKLPAVGLDYLYNYFFNMSVAFMASNAETQKWLEINDIIGEESQYSREELTVLKTIGLLNLLSGRKIIKASADNISLIIEQTNGYEQGTIRNTIKDLSNRGFLLYRAYADEYRLWEGSDFDVYKEIKEKKSELSIGSLEDVLKTYLPLTPLIASKHAYITGTVRKFERRWINQESINKDLKPDPEFDGLFLYSFGSVKKPNININKCSDGKPLLIAYLPSQAVLNELALEVASAKKLLEDAPELVYDNVARKEVKYRLQIAEESFREYLMQAFNPGADNLQWYVESRRVNILTLKKRSNVLSVLCDNCYYKCPHINNEMINYNSLSSSAARARRELIEAMFSCSYEKSLGLKGFGPEVAIYRSLLLKEGLHINSKSMGHYEFTFDSKQTQVKNMWTDLDNIMMESGQSGISLQAIFDYFKRPPYGLREGPIPIYISVYLLLKRDTIAVFREDIYRPFINDAEASLMIKRPDLYRLKQYLFNQKDNQILEIYQNLLQAIQIEKTQNMRNLNLLGVVGPLIKFISGLPEYTLNTKNISSEAIKVRLAIQNSTDPAVLVFQELPKAVGFNLSEIHARQSYKSFGEQLGYALSDLQSAYHNLHGKIESILLSTFDSSDLETLYFDLSNKAKALAPICDDIQLKPFLISLRRKFINPVKWVEGIAGIVVGKPITSWQDDDVYSFKAKLQDLKNRILNLETLSVLSNYSTNNGYRLLSITLPDGVTKRELIQNTGTDEEVKAKTLELLQMPRIKAKAILVNLAEKLLEED